MRCRNSIVNVAKPKRYSSSELFTPPRNSIAGTKTPIFPTSYPDSFFGYEVGNMGVFVPAIEFLGVFQDFVE